MLLSDIPMEANANLPKERVDALLADGVYHYDPSNARDLDRIYTAEATQCLVGYALCPSFSDPAFVVAIKLAREKIAQLEFSVNEQLDIATKHNVDFDVSKAPETIRCRELQDLINSLQDLINQRISLRFLRKSTKGTKKKERSLLGPL